MQKTAIVTGASRGIGFAIARQLCSEGFNLVMVATGTKEKNAGAIGELEKFDTKVQYVQANIADHDDRLRIVEEAVKTFGRIDVLVNNAGVAPLQRADLLTMTEESFDRVIGTNTKGNMFLTQAVANQMIKQEPVNGRRGVIVNISSCSAVVSSTNRGEYCISKAGVSMLTTLYADRLAPEGILVHEIRPGVIYYLGAEGNGTFDYSPKFENANDGWDNPDIIDNFTDRSVKYQSLHKTCSTPVCYEIILILKFIKALLQVWSHLIHILYYIVLFK